MGDSGGGGPGVRRPQRPPVLQEAAVLVAQRAQNPREFFRQRERAGSTSGSTSGTAPPAGPLGTRPGTWGGVGGGLGLTRPQAAQGVGLKQAGDEVLSVGGQSLIPLWP